MTNTSAKTKKLPVFRISWNAYCFLFRHFASFLKLAWLPFVLLMVATTTPTYVMLTYSVSISGIWYWLFRSAFLFVLPALVAVSWHRYVLLGPHSVGSFDAFKIRKPELLFLAITAALIFLTGSVPDIVSGAMAIAFDPGNRPEIISYFYFFLLLPVFLLAFCRFYILLPTIAIGERPSISGVWRRTRASTVRLFMIICLTSGLSGFTFSFLVAYFSKAIPFDRIISIEAVHPLLIIYVTGASISSLTAIFCGGLGATALSLCYRHLTRFEKPTMAAGNELPTTNP